MSKWKVGDYVTNPYQPNVTAILQKVHPLYYDYWDVRSLEGKDYLWNGASLLPEPPLEALARTGKEVSVEAFGQDEL